MKAYKYKKRKKSAKSLAMALADKYFSKYIRLSWKDFRVPVGYCRCITCSKVYRWDRIDCGHFMPRDRQSTRYDEKNVAPQCKECNRFRSGLQYEFGKGIDKIHGPWTAEGMLNKSKILCQRKEQDFREIAKEYREKIKELENG